MNTISHVHLYSTIPVDVLACLVSLTTQASCSDWSLDPTFAVHLYFFLLWCEIYMTDVLDFVLKVFNETAPLGDNYMAQLEQATRMCIEPCSTIAGMLLSFFFYIVLSCFMWFFLLTFAVGGSKRDKYCPVSLETPLFDAITLLDTHNLHRVPVSTSSSLASRSISSLSTLVILSNSSSSLSYLSFNLSPLVSSLHTVHVLMFMV